MNEKSLAKKRLMFIQKEDYNFLAYNLMILLYTLGCDSERTRFRDFKKIAYLVDFINGNGDIAAYEQKDLAVIYYKAQIKKKLLHHLLLILRNKKFIGISLNTTHKSIDIWLTPENIPVDFFNKEYFEPEIQNIQKIRHLFHSLKTVSIKNLTQIIFTQNNVLTWEI